MDEADKKKIGLLSPSEIKENLAAGIYDEKKASYAQYIMEFKERAEAELRFKNLILSVQDSGTKIAKFVDKLINQLEEQTNKIVVSNEKISNSHGKLLFWQIITSIALVVATCGLIYATWAR